MEIHGSWDLILLAGLVRVLPLHCRLYPVFVQLRNHKSTRREFLLNRLLNGLSGHRRFQNVVLASIELMNMRCVILLAAAY